MELEVEKRRAKFNEFIIRYKAASDQLQAINARMSELDSSDEGKKQFMKICAEEGQLTLSLYYNKQINYDRSGFELIDDFLQAVRHNQDKFSVAGAWVMMGAFAGEILCRTFEGEWIEVELMGSAKRTPYISQCVLFGKFGMANPCLRVQRALAGIPFCDMPNYWKGLDQILNEGRLRDGYLINPGEFAVADIPYD